MDNNILVQNLCKRFEDFSLDHVSFKVPKGRIVGFIGENGAGKSTTINLILNEINKDSGQIQVFGLDHTITAIKENIGVVFDECNFHDVFTATDIEKILKGVFKTWDSNLYQEYLQKFKIPTKKKIGAFSKGMKMKLSILCAMAHRPKLLVLDEATTGLDPVARDEVLDLLAMTIGMQNILSFASDEKVNWKKYQLTLPVSSFAVVASKNISVMFTVAVSILGSVIFNALSSVIFQDFDSLIRGFSIATAVVIPLLWTGICLPLTYWFGFRSAQILGLLAVIPLFFFIKYFEDGPGGITVMIASVYSYMLASIIVSALIFGISWAISTAGYRHKRN